MSSLKNFRYFKNGAWISLGKSIVDFNSLEVGKKYYVICGIWSAPMLYCGHVHSKRKYTFTFGETVDSWVKNFNLCGYKKDFEVFPYDED